MKVYDPAFETAKAEVDGMTDIRFVQVNHLHPDNRLHLRQFRLKRFDDLPAGPRGGDAGSPAVGGSRGDRRGAGRRGSRVSSRFREA